MNREELKKHITNFRLNLPQGMKWAVIAQSSAVLESAKDLHCEYLYVAMERPGYNWARMTYGEMETRLEGTWIGTSWLKVYPCYDEKDVVMVDGIPCQYAGETNPFQDDPMLERPVPSIEDFMRKPSQQSNVIRAMADVLKEGMTEKDGLIDISPEAIQAALRVSAENPPLPVVVLGEHPLVTRRKLDTPVPFTGMPLITAPLVLTDKNVDVADVVGDYLGGESLVDAFIKDSLESRSASKALLQNRTPLKDSPFGMTQDYRRMVFRTSEYRGSLVKCYQERMKFTDDEKQNRRRFNNASLHVKVIYTRYLRRMVLSCHNEGIDFPLSSPFSLLKPAVKNVPYGGHIEPEDHSVDSIAVGLGAVREMQEEGPIVQTKIGADIDGDFVDGEYYLDPVGKAQLDRQKAREDGKKEGDK